MDHAKSRQPGDLILDHYMPDASEEEREEARRHLKAYAAALLRVQQRLLREKQDSATRAKDGGGVN
jgi:hypothetical protein